MYNFFLVFVFFAFYLFLNFLIFLFLNLGAEAEACLQVRNLFLEVLLVTGISP